MPLKCRLYQTQGYSNQQNWWARKCCSNICSYYYALCTVNYMLIILDKQISNVFPKQFSWFHIQIFRLSIMLCSISYHHTYETSRWHLKHVAESWLRNRKYIKWWRRCGGCVCCQDPSDRDDWRTVRNIQGIRDGPRPVFEHVRHVTRVCLNTDIDVKREGPF